MDWLGGLSSIKGQLTNITKDLLAEGTREINADPESELSTARTRICELESVVETQKTEINSLRCRNEELVVQLESLQLRLDHTKELFIQQLREKDVCFLQFVSVFFVYFYAIPIKSYEYRSSITCVLLGNVIGTVALIEYPSI
ncbi:unnamed protein product [Schistosoma margrebowiei]|uniref:Uncharacterized protein n=1 Tax=Schistosoma margrebowiei TaxID=48269 RepID=A0A183MV07_9TREM|nr:unnamed protein product [Schistosoma margrebowiei]